MDEATANEERDRYITLLG